MRRVLWRSVAALTLCFPLRRVVLAAECTQAPYDCALFYVEHQDFEAGIRSLTLELQQTPRNLNALNLLGIALTASGHPEQGSTKFKQALAIDPHFYPARKNLAINRFDGKR